MSKKQKITHHLCGTGPTTTNTNGEPIHPHVFLALDHNCSTEQGAYDTKTRDYIVDLVSSTWNIDIQTQHLPTLTEYRSETLNECIRKLRLHFANVESRISVEAGYGGSHKGHHPLFSKNTLHRNIILDPTRFTKIPSFEFLDLGGQMFRPSITSEIQENNNLQLQNFLIFNSGVT